MASLTIGNNNDLLNIWKYIGKITPSSSLTVVQENLTSLVTKLGTSDYLGAKESNGTVTAKFLTGENLFYSDSTLTYVDTNGISITLNGFKGLLTRLPSDNIIAGLKNPNTIKFTHAVVSVPNGSIPDEENVNGTANIDAASSFKWDVDSNSIEILFRYSRFRKDFPSTDTPTDTLHFDVLLNDVIRKSDSVSERAGVSREVTFLDNANTPILTMINVNFDKSNELMSEAVQQSTPDDFIRIFLRGNDTLKAQNTSSYIDGMDGNDSINGGLGNDTLIGSNGNDTVAGGAGNDNIVGGHGAGDDKYDGGTGIDTATYTSALAGLKIDLTKTSSTVTSIDGHNAAGIGTDALKNIENIVAGDFNDNILGNTIANNLFGGAGNDTINGNTGKDTLTGGLGADVFVFNTALNASTNLDTITDFTPKEDSISLKKSIFSKLSVDSNQHVQLYQSIALPTSSKVGYLVYNAANGELAYDADGSAGKAPVKIAIVGIDTHPALSATDFSLV